MTFLPDSNILPDSSRAAGWINRVTSYTISYTMSYTRIRCRIRYRILYRIRHRIRYSIFPWHHLRSVKWRGRASVDRVCLPHPIPGSRSLFSCLYSILCQRKPLSQHVQHTLPVTPWLIIYSGVNAVLRAIRLYSPIIVHFCLYLRT